MEFLEEKYMFLPASWQRFGNHFKSKLENPEKIIRYKI
jgi:hypothetical protein